MRDDEEMDIKASNERVRLTSLVKLVETNGLEVKVIVVTLVPEKNVSVTDPTRFGTR